MVEKVGTLTEGSWLGEITCTLAENVLRLHSLSSLPPSPAVSEARAAAFRAVVRCICDWPLAAHFLKIGGPNGPFATHPHGHFGALGAVSSAISLYEMWPTLLVGVPAKKA